MFGNRRRRSISSPSRDELIDRLRDAGAEANAAADAAGMDAEWCEDPDRFDRLADELEDQASWHERRYHDDYPDDDW
jgi:hypothetical protein